MLPEVADDITLHYQPFTDATRKVVGLETLMRWHHRQRGTISPEAFIPIFENCGLIVPLSRWALRQACADAAAWRRPMLVSVTLSPMQFEQDDIPAVVASILAETGLAPERLELNIVQACVTADPERAGRDLRALAAQGILLALDDVQGDTDLPFVLKDYPFATVKIARRLVQQIDVSVSARSLIHMIMLVGRTLNLPVAAKGVETAGQLAFVLSQGCDLLQGALVSRPAQIQSFAALTGNLPEDFSSASTRPSSAMHVIVPTYATAPSAMHAA